ncbi:DUF4236 domain-containing protein [Caballeronia sp. INDeC2]|uniref:DUF4236 domain-containing protein n=1 Tax=Caballeronia sp. INDeC2 TaxID=2921747 RepID=UPI002027ED91|nr:DUF4236 domain-containing protein [Caballeronia sp. INDeC2]
MGFGFRKSIKILPGVRVKLSKSGISTSIGVKGFTYNTRGRITTSIPGTGIYHVTNLKSKGPRQPSRRQAASLEFRLCVQERVVCALRGYFLSHGIYVSEANLGEATELVEHKAFIESLSPELEIVHKAARLATDIGSISLAEKEKAMRAAYAIESACASRHGAYRALNEVVASAESKVQSLPAKPTFSGPFVLGLLGSFLLPVGLLGALLLIAAACWGGRRFVAYENRKSALLNGIGGIDTQFDALVVKQLSPRPDLALKRDRTWIGVLVRVAIVAAAAAAFSSLVPPHHDAPASTATENAAPADHQRAYYRSDFR